MLFTQFLKGIEHKVAGIQLESQAICYGHLVQETAEGKIFIDRVPTQFSSLEEAVESLKQQKLTEDIQKQIQQEIYEEMSDNKVANIIKQHHGAIRVTDTLIESYVELASSKLFTTDPVAFDLRKFNKLDRIVEGKFDYILDDGSKIAITEDTQIKLNNIFGQHPEVVEYMRKSAENFLSVLDQIEE